MALDNNSNYTPIDSSRYSAEQDLQLIFEAVREAGKIAMEYFCTDVERNIKGDGSPVSQADLHVNNYLREYFAVKRPNYGWLSEETPEAEYDLKQDCGGRFFIVDPIDGTRGFLSHDERWCISVALAENDKIIAAGLYLPVFDEFYSAVAGKSFCNRDILQLSPKRVAMQKASEEAARNLRVCLPRSRREAFNQAIVNHLGDYCIEFVPPVPSLAYNIIQAAKGEVDIIVIRPSCKIWDIAAADLILQNMGGCLVIANGEVPSYNDITGYKDYLFCFHDVELYKKLAVELSEIIR